VDLCSRPRGTVQSPNSLLAPTSRPNLPKIEHHCMLDGHDSHPLHESNPRDKKKTCRCASFSHCTSLSAYFGGCCWHSATLISSLLAQRDPVPDNRHTILRPSTVTRTTELVRPCSFQGWHSGTDHFNWHVPTPTLQACFHPALLFETCGSIKY
jgi:hypothetical protein